MPIAIRGEGFLLIRSLYRAMVTDRPRRADFLRHLARPQPGWELAVFLAAIASVVAVYWSRLLWLPHMVERVEIQVLSLTLWWQSGLFPYVHPTALPVLQNPYGPLYPWLCMQLPAAAAQPYLVGRCLSLLAIFLALGLVFVWVRRRSGSWWLASVCALLPLTTKPIILFAPLYRVDSLALLFSVAGFVAVTSLPDRRGVGLGGAAFLLAFITKMTFVAAPLAVAIYLWLSGRRGLALGSAALTAITLPAAVAILELLSDGAYLASASMGNLPTSPLKSFDMLLRTGLTGFWLAALLAIGTARRFDPRQSPAFLYALSSLVVGAAFAANPLSSWNYLMEFYVALGLLTGEVLRPGVGQRRVRPAAVALLVLHAAVTLPLAVSWMHRADAPLTAHRWRYEAALQRLRPWIEAAASDPGSPVVVLESLAGYDALNALGAPNPVSVPHTLEKTALVDAAVDRARRRGTVRVLRGDDWLRAEPDVARSEGPPDDRSRPRGGAEPVPGS